MKIILIDYADGTKSYQHVESKIQLEEALNKLKDDPFVEYLEVLYHCKPYDFWANPDRVEDTEF